MITQSNPTIESSNKARQHTKSLLVSFLIENGVAQIGIHLILMYQIPSINCPLNLAVAFLLIYDLFDFYLLLRKHKKLFNMSMEALSHQPFSKFLKVKTKFLLVESLASVIYKISMMSIYQLDFQHYIVLVLPGFVMLYSRIKIYRIQGKENDCLTIINAGMICWRLILLLATFSLALKLDNIVKLTWRESLWFFWGFFSVTIGINFGLLLMIISRTFQLCLSKRNSKPDELKSLLWFSELSTAASVGSYMWNYGTIDLLERNDSTKLYQFLFFLIIHFCLTSMASTFWFESIIDTMLPLLFEDQIVSATTTMYELATNRQDTQQHTPVVPTPKFLQRISSTYFGLLNSFKTQPQSTKNQAQLQMGGNEKGNLKKEDILSLNSPINEEKLIIDEKLKENDKKETDSSSNCMICFEREQNSVFMPCGHAGVCYDCANDLLQKNRQCYLCRSEIQQILQIRQEPQKNKFKVISATLVTKR